MKMGMYAPRLKHLLDLVGGKADEKPSGKLSNKERG